MNIVAETIKEQTNQLAMDYEIDKHNIIRSPGKFEAENKFSLYFYDCIMNGGSDESELDEHDQMIDSFVLVYTRRWSV